MKFTVLLYIFFVSSCMGGCAMAPDAVSTGYSHTSHPLRGAPFGGEEDSLDVADVEAEWRLGPYTIELALGYKLRDGGVAGDDCTFHGRISRDIWSR
jgi:hypothetical protein